jgi:ferredoxin-NADP reductase
MLKLKVFNYQNGDFKDTVLTPEVMTHAEYRIGRTASCHLVLESPDISRVHSRIRFENGSYHYMDLGSANGSRINNCDIQANQNYPLKLDDLIRIGDYVLLVEAIETPAAIAENSIWSKIGSQRQWSQGELTVRCVRIVNETSDVKTFTFVAEPKVLFHYKPGQFVTLEIPIQNEIVYRSYSISSSPSRPHTLEITVKRVAAPADQPEAPAGVVSNWLHDHLQVGSSIKINGPLGKFTCAPDPAKKLLLISAGSGITPLMSMSRWIAETAIASNIVFFHCARTPNDIIFRTELEMMAARLPNFRLAFSTTQSASGQPWWGFTGRLTPAMLEAIAPDFLEQTVYVCGPNGFMAGVKTLLEGLNFPLQNYYEESFGGAKKPKPVEQQQPKPATSLVATPTAPQVVFAQSDKKVACDGSLSILEIAEQEGIKIRSSCRQGVCGACKKRKLEGEVRYESEPDALEPDEQAKGYVLTCVANPVGKVVIEA